MVRSRAAMTRVGSPIASSMYRDLLAGNIVEVDQILGDLLERAHGFGVATPLLATAYAHLKVYQARLEPAPALGGGNGRRGIDRRGAGRFLGQPSTRRCRA